MELPVGKRTAATATALCLFLGACSEPMDMDLRGLGEGFSTAEAARQPSGSRPRPDARGVISYPNYQVVVAQPGDAVADVAGRVGLPPQEVAAFNGVPDGVTFRGGEVLVLPRRVAEPSAATGAIASGPIQPGTVDVTAIAGAAIDRSGPGTARSTATPSVQTGAEPLRHRVERGETAFTIARLYNVSVRALADWNGLDADFNVREGQYLLIPVTAGSGVQTAALPAAPGAGSSTPQPPSAAAPLPPAPPPQQETQPAAPPPAALAEERTAASNPGAMMMPVNGSIIRPYVEGQTDGIAIAAAAGTAVRAARDGTVAAISRDTNGVPIVVVRHEGNLLTIYSQVDDLAVAQGNSVKRGDTIGRIRQNDPAFLHFEVRQGFESVDPMPFLQ
jgi:murein DD-endopeptidase MepM/ murein hydrolase activator NlpD